MSSHNDTLQALHDDARRLRVAIPLPPEGELSPDQISKVQALLEQFLKDKGISQARLSKMMGDGYSTSSISTFRSLEPDGHYAGDRDRLARGINDFIETYLRREERPLPDGYVETAVAQRIITVINQCVNQRSMGLISGDSGRGKTIVLKAAESKMPGSIYLRVLKGGNSKAGFARMLARKLKLRRWRTTLDIEEMIIEQLTDSQRPLLIDEAHQLSMEALELIRDIHDVAEVPVILCGTRDIEKATSDQDVFFGQLASRIGIRYDINAYARKHPNDPEPSKPIHTVQEVVKLYGGGKLKLTDDGAAYLAKLANLEGQGGLRLCRQIMETAITAAKTKTLDAKALAKVLRLMHGKAYHAQRTQAALNSSNLKVA